MILEFVTFKTPADWDRARVLEDAKHTIPKWVANRDLLRKHFALGVGADEGTSAGIYIWPSVEAARKAHNDEWRDQALEGISLPRQPNQMNCEPGDRFAARCNDKLYCTGRTIVGRFESQRFIAPTILNHITA